MAVDSYIYFTKAEGSAHNAPEGETTDEFYKAKKAFEIKEFSFDIEMPHTIGSATGGAGVGRIKFNEFTIKVPTNKASALFLRNCVTGAHYGTAVISCRKAGDSADTAGAPFLEFCFATVHVSKIEWSGPGDEGPEESITFSYGQLGILYRKQEESGKLGAKKIVGWNQLKNAEWDPGASAFSGG